MLCPNAENLPEQRNTAFRREGRLTLELAEALPSIEMVVRAHDQHVDENSQLAELERVRHLTLAKG